MKEYVSLVTEDNQEMLYKCLLTFDYNKKTYAALMPLQYELYHYSSLPDGTILLNDIEEDMQLRCINYMKEFYDDSMPVVQTFVQDNVKYEIRFIFTLDYEEYAALFHEEYHLFLYEKDEYYNINNEAEYENIVAVFTELYRSMNDE